SEGLKVSFQAGTNEEMINATNVVGVIPGTDPMLKNEYVVISAHHDHLGGTKEDYYPGADDDGSGTTGLMELARQLRTTKNKRSILFLSVSGEEKGLLGSESFLLNSPIPVNQMVANVNIDMIGRMETTRVDVAPARVEKGPWASTSPLKPINIGCAPTTITSLNGVSLLCSSLMAWAMCWITTRRPIPRIRSITKRLR
ncbi:MAG: hypothetical protein RL124_609, partial [Acidobacteriota bacterium]